MVSALLAASVQPYAACLMLQLATTGFTASEQVQQQQLEKQQ
jgi:hypothetical protein